jgi:uncharacterized membrane protein YphA (DoxX/SURF4 family)
MGLGLIVGFMTPLATGLLCATALLALVDVSLGAHLLLFQTWMARIEFIAMSAALVPLGPGAFSVDARLYGRREIAVNGSLPPNDS